MHIENHDHKVWITGKFQRLLIGYTQTIRNECAFYTKNTFHSTAQSSFHTAGTFLCQQIPSLTLEHLVETLTKVVSFNLV